MPKLRTPVLRLIDGQGFARPDPWIAGSGTERRRIAPTLTLPRSRGRERIGRSRSGLPPPLAGEGQGWGCSLSDILDRAAAGETLTEADIVRLFQARGDDFHEVCAAADRLRREVSGDTVTYVVTRNINYTNICYFRCQFCAFSKGKLSENLRGRPYNLDLDEIVRRSEEAWERGATEVCLQGGIHPEYTGATYLAVCRAIKQALPGMHVHAFSPLEVWQGAKTLGRALPDFVAELRDAGLGSLPGTAAEILDDEVRAVICPDKVKTAEWLEVMEAAHRAGLRSTVTIMFGHVERYEHWARHLLRVRALQNADRRLYRIRAAAVRADGDADLAEGPLAARADLARGGADACRGAARAASGDPEHPVLVGQARAGRRRRLPRAPACNDLGGTLMNESISRAAGASFGQEMPPENMEALIRSLGRTPRQRTTLYGEPAPDRIAASFGAAPLSEPINTPARKYERAGQAAAAD